MTFNPPLPFDPCTRDYAEWFDMINSIVGFVTASTHLAATLRNSRCCFPKPVDLSDEKKRNSNEIFYPADFQYFLKDLESALQEASKTPQKYLLSNSGGSSSRDSSHYSSIAKECKQTNSKEFRVKEMPLVQYPMYDLFHGEPNLEPRTFTLIDTQDFGDSEFKWLSRSIPLICNEEKPFSSTPSVQQPSSDCCYFQEFSDSEQTIDSTNLQENFEQVEEECENVIAIIADSKSRGVARAGEAIAKRKSLEKPGKVEKYRAPVEEPSSSPQEMNKVDLYMECTVESTQVLVKNDSNKLVRNQKKKVVTTSTNTTADGSSELTVAKLDGIPMVPSSTHKQPARNSADPILPTNNNKELETDKKGKDETPAIVQQVIPEAELLVRKTLSETVEDVIRADSRRMEHRPEPDRNQIEVIEMDDHRPGTVRSKRVTSNTGIKNTEVKKLKVESILSAGDKKGVSINEDGKTIMRAIKDPAIVKKPPKLSASSKKSDSVESDVNNSKYDNVKAPEKVVSKQPNKEIGKSVTLIDKPLIVPRKVYESRPNAKQSKSKSARAPIRKEDVDVDFIKKNIASLKKAPSGRGKTTAGIPKEKTGSNYSFSNKKLQPSNKKSNRQSNQINDKKSSNSVASKINEATKTFAQEKARSNVKKQVRNLPSKEAPPPEATTSGIPKPILKMPERPMPELRSCLKPSVPQTAVDARIYSYDDEKRLRFPRPTTRREEHGRILPKFPLLQETTLKLTAAATVRKASELLKNVEQNVLRTTADMKRRVVAGTIRPITVGAKNR